MTDDDRDGLTYVVTIAGTAAPRDCIVVLAT